MPRIAIVGGGPGGLFTALLLQEKCADPPEVTIFEATERLGGKIQTRRFRSAPVAYEAGAAELYQYGQDPLRLLIKKILGLPCVRMNGRAVVMDGRILHSPEDLGKLYGKRAAQDLKRFDELARRGRGYDGFYDCSQTAENDHPWAQISLAELLEQEVPDQDARRYIKVLIHSDLASEPEQVSALYGVDNYLMNDPDYCKLYSIEGGVDRLVEALQKAIQAHVALHTRVERIEKCAEGSYRVHVVRGGEPACEDFDAVVVALPMAWLPGVAWGGERLQRAMAAHIEHYDHPAHYLRVSVLFERPFWRDQIDESFFMIDAFDGCCVYDEGSRHDTGTHGVLAWLLAGAAAERMSRLSDDEVTAAVLASLPSPLAAGRDCALEARVHRWINSVNARPGGRFLKGQEERHLLDPEGHPGLFIVGDYMFDTSINGALDSADYATDLIVDAFKLPARNVGTDYFDYYVGTRRYVDSYQETFDARYVAGLIEQVWGLRPPYTLLDAGSACGLTLAAFDELGIDAQGVENCRYIHAQTRKKWRDRNLLADVIDLPFPDDSFDIVYETCLAYVPKQQLERALDELFRVTRHGLVLGSAVSDMRPDLVKRYDLFKSVSTLLSLDEWTDRLREHGFDTAPSRPVELLKLWTVSPLCYGGQHLFSTAAKLGGCFFTKRGAEHQALPFKRAPYDGVKRSRRVV